MEKLTKSQSENLLKLVVENNLAAVFRTTLQGDFIAVNESYLRIFGFENFDDLQKHKSTDFYANIESREIYLRDLKSKGKLTNYLIENRDRYGNELFLIANVKICSSNPEVLEGSFVDISQHFKKDQIIRNQNTKLERLSLYLEHISDSVYVVNRNGIFSFMNKIAREKLSIPLNNLHAYTVCDISQHFKTLNDFQNHFDELKLLQNYVVESTHKNVLDGSLHPIELSIHYERFGEEDFLIATGRDISEQIIQRRALDLKNKIILDLNSAIDSAAMVSYTDKNGIIKQVNDYFLLHTGYSRNELVGYNNSKLSSGYHNNEFWQNFYQTVSSGQTFIDNICNRKKNGDIFWVRSLIYPIKDSDGKIEAYMSILQDITNEKIIEERNAKHVEFQNLLMKFALELLNGDLNHINLQINNALESIGKFVNCDRAYIFEYNHQNSTSSNTYEWCNVGIEPQIDNLQNIPFSELPEWIESHFKGKTIEIPDVDKLPESNTKELLSQQDIKSIIAVPLLNSNICTGFVGFDYVQDTISFSQEIVKALQIFAQIIANVEDRVKSQRLIEESNEKISKQNLNLQNQIAKELEKSNDLNQKIAQLDRYALLGELTSEIAHDLNTPISAIQVGAISTREILENLFKHVLSSVTLDQVHYSCSRAVESNIELFVGSLQQLRETENLRTYIQTKYPNLLEAEKIIRAMVKARITIDKSEDIEKIISSPNPLEFLNVIYHIQAIRTFIDTIMEASEKADSIVKNMKFYQKDGSKDSKFSNIIMQKNIKEVLDVFNHKIRQQNISIEFKVNDSVTINAIPEKLYQLWANLLVNAIDATGMNGWIEIMCIENDEHVMLSISNTGPSIPLDLQSRIWERFYTTKKDKGTGLGLSIVKRIIDEHNASISLFSENDMTNFTIQFPKNSH